MSLAMHVIICYGRLSTSYLLRFNSCVFILSQLVCTYITGVTGCTVALPCVNSVCTYQQETWIRIPTESTPSADCQTICHSSLGLCL